MWSDSAISLDENLEIVKKLPVLLIKANTTLEIEVGTIGDEEDGVVSEINEELYTPTADDIKTVEAPGLGEKGRCIAALTFDNMHGVYKPGHVRLRSELLDTIQKEAVEHFGPDHRLSDLVMYDGSDSIVEEIATVITNGAIKMNVDTGM